MAKTPTADAIRAEIARELGVPVERCTDDTTIEQLGGDSLDVIEVVMACEEFTRSGIPDEWIGDTRVGTLIRLTQKCADGIPLDVRGADRAEPKRDNDG